MREVTEALEAYTQSGPDNGSGIHPFQVASTSWAMFSLRNLRGRRLRKALKVAVALAEYAALDDLSGKEIDGGT